MRTDDHDPVVRWSSLVSVILLCFILLWALVATIRGPTVAERLDRVESQLTYQSCLLLIPEADRPVRGVAECQFHPEPEETP